MSGFSPGQQTDETRRRAAAARLPVLARLPDASTEKPAVQSTQLSGPGGIGYRFDPPQQRDRAPQSSVNADTGIGHLPHSRDRVRPVGQRGIPRRESPVLPRTNPFANPRPRLVDSLAPAVRFLTMVALVTAAGVWVQTVGRRSAPSGSSEVPKTAAQPALAPAKSVLDNPISPPTATGPIGSHSEPAERVGRADGNDLTSQGSAQSTTAVGPVPAMSPTVAPPHFLISAGSPVPRVRVLDSASASAATPGSIDRDTKESAESDDAAALARYPGFSMDPPQR